jgi:thiol-disulfide isomerase/thioredoxin
MEKLMAMDPGLPRRFPKTLELPNYTPLELTQIAHSAAMQSGFEIGEEALQKLPSHIEAEHMNQISSHNGGLAVQLVEAAIGRLLERIVDQDLEINDTASHILACEDFQILTPILAGRQDAGLKSTDAIQVLGDEFQDKDNQTFSQADRFTKEFIGIYFSAHWCPPCRDFTPKLAQSYSEGLRDKMEIVFVSSDRDEQAFKEYLGEMPWLALPYSKRAEKETLSKIFGVEGIPTFVILDKDSNIITSEGTSYTPLMLAARLNHLEVVEKLASMGADVTAVMVNGETALHCAAAGAGAEVVEALVRLNADVAAVSADGKTAYEVAIGLGHWSVVAVLEAHGVSRPAEYRGLPLSQLVALRDKHREWLETAEHNSFANRMMRKTM